MTNVNQVPSAKYCRCARLSAGCFVHLAMYLSRLIRPRWRRILNPPAMGSRGEERDSGLLRDPSRTATSSRWLLPAMAATICSMSASRHCSLHWRTATITANSTPLDYKDSSHIATQSERAAEPPFSISGRPLCSASLLVLSLIFLCPRCCCRWCRCVWCSVGVLLGPPAVLSFGTAPLLSSVLPLWRCFWKCRCVVVRMKAAASQDRRRRPGVVVVRQRRALSCFFDLN